MLNVVIMHVHVIHINGFVHDYSNSIANALEFMQSCTKPFIYQPTYHSIYLNSYEAKSMMQLLHSVVLMFLLISGIPF